MAFFRKQRNGAQSTGVVLRRDRLVLVPPGGEAIEYPLEQGGYEATLKTLLKEGRLEGPLVVGVDPELDFFVCRCGKHNQDSKDQYLDYLENQVSGGLHIESVDTGGGFHAILAWPKKAVDGARKALRSLPRSQLRMAPATHALFQMALCNTPTPRKWRCHIRVIVGPQQGIALLVQKDTLLARRVFNRPDAESNAPVTAGLMGLLAHARGELGIKNIDGLVFHIGEEREEEARRCAESAGLPVVLGADLEYGGALLGRALAAVCWRGRGSPPLEVFHATGKEESGLPRFPAKAAAPAFAALAGSVAWLYIQLSGVNTELARMESEREMLVTKAGIDASVLVDALDPMRIEVGIAHSYLVQRAVWSQLIGEVPRLLPKTARLESLIGRYPLLLNDGSEDDVSYSLGERFLHLVCIVPAGRQSSPPEVAQLMAGLQGSEPIREVFPVIRGAGVQLIEGDAGMQALISVDCEPRGG